MWTHSNVHRTTRMEFANVFELIKFAKWAFKLIQSDEMKLKDTHTHTVRASTYKIRENECECKRSNLHALNSTWTFYYVDVKNECMQCFTWAKRHYTWVYISILVGATTEMAQTHVYSICITFVEYHTAIISISMPLVPPNEHEPQHTNKWNAREI